MFKKIFFKLIFFVLITISSCGQNCKEIPNSFINYAQAKEIVLDSNFKFTDKADVSDSSWITSAKYFSCDGLNGFFIIKTKGKTYIHQNMPYKMWKNFKQASSKGSYYSRNIKGNYQLKLQ